MMRSGSIGAILLIGIVAQAASGQPGGPGNASPYYPTEHFRVTPNGAMFNNITGPGGLLTRFEKTHAAVTALVRQLGVPTTQPAEKMSVILATDRDTFRGLAYGAGIEKSDTLLGFFDRGSDQTVLIDFTVLGDIPRKRSQISELVNPVRSLPPTNDAKEQARRDAFLKQGAEQFAAVEQLEEQLFRTVVQHEVAHLVLCDLGVPPRDRPAPPWFGEGMAALFEGPLDRFSPRDPGVNVFRLTDYRAAAAEKKLLPWRTVVGGQAEFRPEAAPASTAYAQAWLLAYWAVREEPGKLAAYIRAIQRRGTDSVPNSDAQVAEFELAFGPIGELDAKMTKFAAGLSLPSGK